MCWLFHHLTSTSLQIRNSNCYPDHDLMSTSPQIRNSNCYPDHDLMSTSPQIRDGTSLQISDSIRQLPDLLPPRMRMGGAIPLPSLCACRGISWVDVYLHLYMLTGPRPYVHMSPNSPTTHPAIRLCKYIN